MSELERYEYVCTECDAEIEIDASDIVEMAGDIKYWNFDYCTSCENEAREKGLAEWWANHQQAKEVE